MKFDAYSRSQTQALFELLTGHAAETAKAELEALKSGVDARIAALQKALLPPEHAQLLDKLVQDLAVASRTEADAARSEAETAAAKALLKAQEVAETALSGARAEAQAKIAAEQKESAALRTALDAAQTQLQTAQATAQTELDRARAELEGRLEQVQAARAELARVLAEAQRDAAGAHADLAAQAALLKEAQARMHVLEHEASGLVVSRDEAVSRAEAEARRVQETSDLLVASRNDAAQAKQEARLAKADAEGRRQSLEAAMEQIRALEEAVTAPGVPAPMAFVAPVQTEQAGDAGLSILEHVGTALESIDVAISASEILETLIDHLGRHFAKAAVFLVGPSSFKGWRGNNVGGGGTDIGNIEIPRTIDSLLTRALAERKVATVSGHAGDPAVGVLGSPASTALALPVLANGRVIAVAYAEHAEDAAPSALAVGCKIAEIMIDHANRRLTVKRRSTAGASSSVNQEVDRLGAGTSLEAAAPSYAPARQARRASMKENLEVTLEGTASTLVDMSTLGCQVLSTVAMRPKRVVRLALTTDEGVVVCRGRVVWAQIEPGGSESESKYRAGIKFTEADQQAIESFLVKNGADDGRARGVKEKLEETA